MDDALVADDTAGREGPMALREAHAEAINAAGIPHKLDVGVPLAQLDRFLSEVPGVVRGAGAERAILFGHLGDGNVHVNVLGADPDDSRSTTRCSSSCSSAAGRSAPSTASAWPRRVA